MRNEYFPEARVLQRVWPGVFAAAAESAAAAASVQIIGTASQIARRSQAEVRNAMAKTLENRRWVLVFVAILVCAGNAQRANAQEFISPFIGYNFSGDSGCRQITNCEDKHANYGVAFGALGSIVGFEAELAYTNDFLGALSNESTKVITFMGNFLLAPRIGPIQLYGLGGIGLMRTSVETVGQNNDENQAGWDVGGGLIAYFSSHIGMRGDIRYFHSFQILDLTRLPNLPINERKLDFGRFSVAAVFKF
jgi:opacity protein-like surface antigen